MDVNVLLEVQPIDLSKIVIGEQAIYTGSDRVVMYCMHQVVVNESPEEVEYLYLRAGDVVGVCNSQYGNINTGVVDFRDPIVGVIRVRVHLLVRMETLESGTIVGSKVGGGTTCTCEGGITAPDSCTIC